MSLPPTTRRPPIGAQMIEVPAGDIVLRDEGSGRRWRVEVGAFLLAPHPVTRELYGSVCGEPAAAGTGSQRAPMTEVSWTDAIRFCNRLSLASGLRPCYLPAAGPGSRKDPDDLGGPDALEVICDPGAGGYRLPSEAEWEYACRAGDSGVRYGELDEIAWHRGNSGGAPHDVGTKAPNAWGLHDMIGNVWEWCWDLYDPAVYGPYRVFRGGGAYDPPRGCRASCRRKSHPTLRIDDLGFRLARSP